MVADRFPPLSRRGLLIGGGAGIGLLVGWAAWPRSYRANLNAVPGEKLFNAFVKIGMDGHVTVVVPQVEMGQGVYTTLPQIVADELGADWRTIAVEAAPRNPLYANTLFVEEWENEAGSRLPDGLLDRWSLPDGLMVTGGSTSVRGFEDRLRDAGAAARALLCIAAAARWDADWRACDTASGFVTRGNDRVRFGEIVVAAAASKLPQDIARRSGSENRLVGKSLPRLDAPSKVDGSAQYAADIRLPDMVYASIAQGPLGDTRLKSIDRSAAEKIAGVVAVIQTDGWVAAVATSWWVANKALLSLRAMFETVGGLADDQRIVKALDAAFDDGVRVSSIGDVGAAFRGAQIVTAEYRIGLAPHAAIEPMSATASADQGELQLWIGTQVPGLAAKAAARAIGFDEAKMIVHPMLIGGSFGRRYEVEIAAQVAILAHRLKRPVQLTWSRAEDMRQDRFRPAAAARMAARIVPGGRIDAWLAKIATPATTSELQARTLDGLGAHAAMIAQNGRSVPASVVGAVPPYAIPNVAIDHHPASIGVPTGDWRGRAHGLSAFFTECFIDELAASQGIEPFSYRMGLLGDNPRLALCLSKVATLGGWNGGAAGTAQGLACHSMAGSHVAVMAEARIGDNGRVTVDRLVAVVDCGQVINPDIVRQQIAGGLIFGMSAATGAPVHVGRGLAGPERLGALRLPKLADAPHITIELLVSPHPAGGVGEISVPPVAPAIANALFAATGKRYRTLPLLGPESAA
ncbi:MAG: xanthine dehydrogenase family protein molybdopterin-binding subunit [Sphingomonadales bacterium]|nr:xanthine dehydrogenase family protein molybdopterin-binding subunit [Sphingomonadales bacterium]